MGLEWLNDEATRLRFRWRDDERLTFYDLPGWAMVAMDGWDEWLHFYGLDKYGSLPCERVVLRNLRKQAKELVKAGGATQLAPLHKELIALERYYLEHFEQRDFRVRYSHFMALYYNRADPQLSHKYAWVADRMGFYVGHGADARPDYRGVANLLDEADARLSVLENLGIYVDLNVDIGHLLNVKRTQRAA